MQMIFPILQNMQNAKGTLKSIGVHRLDIDHPIHSKDDVAPSEETKIEIEDIDAVAPEQGAPNEVKDVDLVPFEEAKGGDIGSNEIDSNVHAPSDGIHSEHELALRFGADSESQIVDSESFTVSTFNDHQTLCRLLRA